MAYDEIAKRLAQSRPRVAEELARPHAEEALLAHVVDDLDDADALRSLAVALGLTGQIEQVLLWGADHATGAEDLALASALRTLAGGAGKAVQLEAEPDLVVRTELEVAVVDATVGRPGHAAARAERGDGISAKQVNEVVAVLEENGFGMSTEDVTTHFATARLAAVAIELSQALDLRPVAIALGSPGADLLKPDRDPMAAWSDSAAALLASITVAKIPLTMRALAWTEVADRLDATGTAAATAVFRIRSHPALAPSTD